jgi:hypothetical protein
MDQNRSQPHAQGPQASGDARGQQPSKEQWDGRDRRTGMADRRQHSSRRQGRNTAADVRMMNEGSSR